MGLLSRADRGGGIPPTDSPSEANVDIRHHCRRVPGLQATAVPGSTWSVTPCSNCWATLVGKRSWTWPAARGFYTRLLKRAGASEVTGVDISAEMIRLAENREARHPLGCRYVRADAAAFQPEGPVDLVVAMYLFNYARTAEQLGRFCRACHDALRPGGCLIGVNDNVRNVPSGTASLSKYGLERSLPRSGGRGRCRPLHHHQCRRTPVPVRQLLPSNPRPTGPCSARPDFGNFAGWTSGYPPPRGAIPSGTTS